MTVPWTVSSSYSRRKRVGDLRAALRRSDCLARSTPNSRSIFSCACEVWSRSETISSCASLTSASSFFDLVGQLVELRIAVGIELGHTRGQNDPDQGHQHDQNNQDFSRGGHQILSGPRVGDRHEHGAIQPNIPLVRSSLPSGAPDFVAGCIRFDGFADRSVQSATLREPAGRAGSEPRIGMARCDAWRFCRSCVLTYQVTELLGDGIGPELSRAIHRLAEALPIRARIPGGRFLGSKAEGRAARRFTTRPSRTITATRVALKHPTTTAEESPNAILRRRLELSVIHRPVYTIPGVPTNFRRELDLDIVRIATGGTYDDPGRMIGDDGAVSLRIVERGPVREAARYAFNLARKTGKRVTSSSKYTIQKATDGLFEQVAQEVAGQFPEVPHSVELFDALLGKVIMAPEKFQIVLVLNEYGDFLSDMACGLAGSLGIGASANLGFDPAAVVRVALFDAAHGTAPDIAGKNLANPTAIFLALSLLLYQLGEIAIGQAVKNATLDLLRQGVRTRDLGGKESTESFTEAVAAEVATAGIPIPRPPAKRPGATECRGMAGRRDGSGRLLASGKVCDFTI